MITFGSLFSGIGGLEVRPIHPAPINHRADGRPLPVLARVVGAPREHFGCVIVLGHLITSPNGTDKSCATRSEKAQIGGNPRVGMKGAVANSTNTQAAGLVELVTTTTARQRLVHVNRSAIAAGRRQRLLELRPCLTPWTGGEDRSDEVCTDCSTRCALCRDWAHASCARAESRALHVNISLCGRPRGDAA